MFIYDCVTVERRTWASADDESRCMHGGWEPCPLVSQGYRTIIWISSFEEEGVEEVNNS